MHRFADELIRRAREEAATPEGRARIVDALRRALAEVDPPPPRACLCQASARLTPMLEDLAGELIMLGDRAEWMAERARALMTPPHRRAATEAR